MSEELTQKTPIPSQDFTQKGSISLPDFNFSIQVNVRLTADPLLQAALDRIAEALQPAQNSPETCQGPEIVFHGLTKDQTTELVKKGVIDSAMTGLEQVPEPEPEHVAAAGITPEEPEKYGHIVMGGPDWKRGWESISCHPRLHWKTEGKVLKCSYGSAVTETTWKEMERIAKLPRDKRILAIRGIIGDKPAANKKASITLFVRLLAEGKIKKPDPDEELKKNFSQFVKEEDPDAVFRPMLTSYSTRPDENAGKVEGYMGEGV